MEWNIRRREEGQVLVQVALMILVLLLFVGLAVDVGNVYAERRHMQNAADAGALAGAREICFGDPAPANVVGQAERYACQENGAQDAEVEIIEGYKVRVLAMVAAETYFIRLIPGLETIDVSADATAACGDAVSGCGFFPIAFDLDTWDSIGCDKQFLVWDDDTVTDDLCLTCDCEGMEEEFGGEISANIGPGQRGWVTLSAPGSLVHIPEECGNISNCGADALKCWLEHDYPGEIDIGRCVPGKPGVVQDALVSAGSRVGGDKDTVRILIWSETACTDDIKAPGCEPGGGDERWYYIANFGCVKIEQYEKRFTLPPNLPHTQNECPKNAKVIRVTRLCPCPNTECGSSAGNPIPEGSVGAVSLIE